MWPKVFTPQDIAEMQGTSYNKALGDLQQSGLAWKIGRRWFLYDSYYEDFVAWQQSAKRASVS